MRLAERVHPRLPQDIVVLEEARTAPLRSMLTSDVAMGSTEDGRELFPPSNPTSGVGRVWK